MSAMCHKRKWPVFIPVSQPCAAVRAGVLNRRLSNRVTELGQTADLAHEVAEGDHRAPLDIPANTCLPEAPSTPAKVEVAFSTRLCPERTNTLARAESCAFNLEGLSAANRQRCAPS